MSTKFGIAISIIITLSLESMWALWTLLLHKKVTWRQYPVKPSDNTRTSDIANQALAWASCQIRHIAGAHAPGMSGTLSPPPQVRDPDMHHGTCVTHVPGCMSGSLISGFLWSRLRGETFPAFPAHAQATILRIWQEAHAGLPWRIGQVYSINGHLFSSPSIIREKPINTGKYFVMGGVYTT